MSFDPTVARRTHRTLEPYHGMIYFVREGAELARDAARRACEAIEGRALFAGHASLPWPDDDHLVLWHALTLLREFRGDGHVAALTVAGLTGCEALVVHGATGEVPASVLK